MPLDQYTSSYEISKSRHMGQISETTKSNKHKDRRPKSEPNLRLQETITGISSRYPQATPQAANKLILHAVYPFIQIGRRSTTDHWELTSHQS